LAGAGAVALTAVTPLVGAPHGTGAVANRTVVTDVALAALTPHDIVLALGTAQMGFQEAAKLRTAARVNAVQQLSQASSSAVTVALDNNTKAREAIGDELVVALEVLAAPSHDVVLALSTAQMGFQEAAKLRTAARVNAVQQLSQATSNSVTVALDNKTKARAAIGDELVVALQVLAAPKTTAATVSAASTQTGRHAAVTRASQTVKAVAKSVEAGVKASAVGRHRKQ
jgi:hypothetical protein